MVKSSYPTFVSGIQFKACNVKELMVVILFCILVFFPMLVSAQSCGVFASPQDFLDNRLTYEFDNCKAKIRMNKDVVAYHRGNKLRFNFRFIYGYTDGRDLYRAYGVKNLWTDHGYYKVVYDRNLIIYQRTLVDYRSNVQTHYYFSLTKDSPILPLRKRFYQDSPYVKENLRLYLSSLQKPAELPTEVLEDEELSGIALIARAKGTTIESEKKKPDISARLQTTTRRPKIFNVRSWWRKQERILLF